MDSAIATASADLLRIRARRAGHLAYRGLQKVVPGSEPESGVRSVLLYPPVDSPRQLGDLRSRLGWYLPSELTDGCEVHVGLPTGIGLDPGGAADPPDALVQYDTDHLRWVAHPPGELGAVAAEVDAVLLWDASRRYSPVALRHLPRVFVVDPAYYSGVPSWNWLRLSAAARRERPDPSSEVFGRLERTFADASDAFVFATGPSLDDAFEFEFPDDALTVVCNSIVRNEDLLDHLDPDVLVFADQVFHFGPTRYAHAFREDAAAALREYDCVGVVPARHRSLFTGHYPDLADSVVGIEPVPADAPIYPSRDRLEVMETGNVMTLFMLPVASALADRVTVVGADGRREDESYFWEHSETAQYGDELMNGVAESHPAFFRDRVYEDYYRKHVETLAAMLEDGERRGRTYRSLTPSYVEALRRRRVAAP